MIGCMSSRISTVMGLCAVARLIRMRRTGSTLFLSYIGFRLSLSSSVVCGFRLHLHIMGGGFDTILQHGHVLSGLAVNFSPRTGSPSWKLFLVQ